MSNYKVCGEVFKPNNYYGICDNNCCPNEKVSQELFLYYHCKNLQEYLCADCYEFEGYCDIGWLG